MDITYHHIRRLYLEKLTGTISEEDDSRLHELLHDDAVAQSIWDELEKERKRLDADNVLAGIDPGLELEQLNKKIEPDPGEVARPALGWWKWAAAIILTAGLSYYLSDRFISRDFLHETTLADKSGSGQAGKVKLVLSDGRVVEFAGEGTEKHSVAGMVIESSGNKLNYTGGGRSAGDYNSLEIPATQDFSITLSDGTRVFLNSESKFRFPFYFDEKTREVFVEGEAYLEVTEDSDRPFIVHTSLTDIQVLGTRFNVNTYREGTVRTSLLEGSVSLKAPDDKKPLLISPGTEATYARQNGFTTNSFDASELLSWREGIFYFQNQPLEELSGQLSRWFGVEVVFERENLAQYTVSGMMEKGYLDEFLNDLHQTSGIQYSLKENKLFLK